MKGVVSDEPMAEEMIGATIEETITSEMTTSVTIASVTIIEETKSAMTIATKVAEMTVGEEMIETIEEIDNVRTEMEIKEI
jgi:hypothetical protein